MPFCKGGRGGVTGRRAGEGGVSVASRRCPGGGRPHSAARQGRNDGGGNTRRRESWAAGLGRGERGAVTVLTERVSACAIKFLIGHSETASQLCHHFHARRSGVGRWRRTRHIYTHTNNQTASCHTRLCHVLLLLLFIPSFSHSAPSDHRPRNRRCTLLEREWEARKLDRST